MVNEKYDVCVVGAGIVGMTTAYELSNIGKKVNMIFFLNNLLQL